MALAIKKLQRLLNTLLVFTMSLGISVVNLPLANTLRLLRKIWFLRQWSTGQRRLTHAFAWRLEVAISYLSMLQSGGWTKWAPEVPFNLNYSTVPSWYLIKSEDQVTDLASRPCRALLSITLARSWSFQLDSSSYHRNSVISSVMHGIACKENVILDSLFRRKKEVPPVNNLSSFTHYLNLQEKLCKQLCTVFFIKKVKP